MTECVTATMCRPGDSDETIAATCGRVVDGLELRIADPASGQVLGPGAEGAVPFRGAMVMPGYLDDEEPSAAATAAAGWLHPRHGATVEAHGYLLITARP